MGLIEVITALKRQAAGDGTLPSRALERRVSCGKWRTKPEAVSSEERRLSDGRFETVEQHPQRAAWKPVKTNSVQNLQSLV
ncbi:hypothetical protein Y1Q_0016208 [Alligator mississippiensis]|uniref:Uncharacterized protein n=1 Tax=Alligator mississippiensis TaxID=8496 RepID=A0A151P171_ALLMI|nr:hypothetical protein Y1Q_0016208 [Alligator mississippiensis]